MNTEKLGPVRVLGTSTENKQEKTECLETQDWRPGPSHSYLITFPGEGWKEGPREAEPLVSEDTHS